MMENLVIELQKAMPSWGIVREGDVITISANAEELGHSIVYDDVLDAEGVFYRAMDASRPSAIGWVAQERLLRSSWSDEHATLVFRII